MTKYAFVFCLVTLLGLMSGGCNEKTPTRDHIPALKEALFRLQEAVKTRDRVVIDSLLSVKILKQNQNSDSLLGLVYGPGDAFAFERFALGEITYTRNKARIDCYMMDSSHRRDRPVVLTFMYEHDMWLLKRFEPGDTVR